MTQVKHFKSKNSFFLYEFQKRIVKEIGLQGQKAKIKQYF
jgi:hypothetical protein